MLTANVYSTEALTANCQEAIEYGLHYIAEYVGGITLRENLQIKLPTTDGLVDHIRTGYDGLDIFTDLHIFAAPLQGDKLGVAWIGRGVAWLNLAQDTYSATTHLTIAHEVSHALGFVRDKSGHNLSGNTAHCSCLDCIMYPIKYIDHDTHITQNTSVLRRIREGKTRVVTTQSTAQQAFCGDCMSDMHDFSSKHIAEMRYQRLVDKSILPKHLIRKAAIAD